MPQIIEASGTRMRKKYFYIVQLGLLKNRFDIIFVTLSSFFVQNTIFGRQHEIVLECHGGQ